MKTIEKLLIVTIFLFFVGCSDINQSFTDGYHENPNDPTDAPLESIFTASQAAMMVFQEGHSARLANMWTQHATGGERQYGGYYTYNITGDALAFGGVWSLVYTDVLSNLRLIQEKGKESEDVENILAVSKIIEAVTIGTVTSLWGDVPYSQAVNSTKNQTPDIDNQQDIYNDVQQLLDEAIVSLENNPQNLVESIDIYSYNGDSNKWLKAAYTLKARFYIHTGNYESAIEAAENGIQAVDGSEDLNFIHGTTYNGNMNLWYSHLEIDRVGYLTATENHAYPLMENRQTNKTNESGRMSFFYTEDGTDLNTNATGAFAQDADYSFLTAAETYLILAEANQRLGATTKALSFLNKAREYNQIKYPNSTYSSLTDSDFESDEDILQEIFDETYLSLISQIEVFNFCRRIDYQVTGLEPVSAQDNFPERFLYPNSEQNANPNIPAQSASQDLFNPTFFNE